MKPVLRRLRFRRFSTVQLLIALLVVFCRGNHFRQDLVPPAVFLCRARPDIFVVAHLLLFILRAPVVTVEVLCASISAYLMQRGVDHRPLSPLLTK